jgi:hypothetical protein
MTAHKFVGRHEATERLRAILKGEIQTGRLTIQSIEGPGGIGKTCLFDHVITTTDLTPQHYLKLHLDGNEPSQTSLIRLVDRMIDGADAEAIRDRPPGYYFQKVDQVVKAMETIKSEALDEFKRKHPSDEEGQLAISRFLDRAFETGKGVNDVFPFTKKYFSFSGLEKRQKLLETIIPTMISLQKETPWFFERLGIGESITLKNSIKENAFSPLAEAIQFDLSAILVGYRPRDITKAVHRKIRGIDRLLVVIDDYEQLHESIGDFLVTKFLPALKNANFRSVVIILGRDQLEATHFGWDQHLKSSLLERLELNPLTRQEVDELVESFGIQSLREKERVWRDTQGYPFYVQLWIEEVESGGRGALTLKRFYDRTTRWMSDKEKEWLYLTLFLNKVDKRTLQSMIGDPEEADSVLSWFEREGSVRDTTGNVYRVREYLRSRLSDYLRITDPDKFEALDRKSRLIQTA